MSPSMSLLTLCSSLIKWEVVELASFYSPLAAAYSFCFAREGLLSVENIGALADYPWRFGESENKIFSQAQYIYLASADMYA